MTSRISQIVGEEFEILEEKATESGVELVLGLPRGGSLEQALVRVYRNLIATGYYTVARADGRGLVLYVFKGREGGERILLIVLLALATLVTVTISSLSFRVVEDAKGSFSWSIVAYPIGLLAPLILHEVGHALAMRIKKVPASPPYLLPAPPLQLGFLGTFGAVINMRWLPATLNDLAVVALAGPLAGFIVALPLAYLGISQSVVEISGVSEGFRIPILPLISLLLLSVAVDAPEGSVVLLSPLAFATMIVFLVTFLNLVPVGMLDGGHVVRALMGERIHKYVSLATIGLAVAVSLLIPIFVLYVLLLILVYTLSRGRHPGSSFEIEIKSHTRRVAVALAYATLLVLTLPIPIV